MLEIVYSLEEAPEDPALVGGKGAGLARLVRYGLPVPPGFVLPAGVFRAYLAANGLDGGLAQDGDAEARLRSGSWPDGVRSAVERAYAALCEGTDGASVAVRSSATAEDSRFASFAGQHATLLNIGSVDEVFDAIIVCWASLYSEEALQYRKMQGIEDEGPAMAVVVQAFVPSEAAGVVFTLDPVAGSSDVVVIEGAWGLGEVVVAGIVTPDHFAVRKTDGEIVRREVNAQKIQVVAAESGGTRNEELSGDRANQPALSDDQAVELAKVAAGIEEQAGAPQDIEWALADGTFYILQARPITTTVPPPPPPTAAAPEGWVSEFDTDTNPDTIWTAANVQEVLPGQLSPFSCSINTEMIERYGSELVERIGIRLQTRDPFFAFFYGRAFLNVTMMLEVVDQTPFGSPEALMDQFLGVGRDSNVSAFDFTLPKKPLWRRMARYMAVFPRIIWHSVRMPAQVRSAEKTVEEFHQEVEQRPFSERSDAELIEAFDDGLERGAEVSITHVSGGGITSSSFEWLRRLTERWLGDETGSLQATLCTGLAGLESAQPAYQLWDISRAVLASEPLRLAFEPANGAEIERQLDVLPRDDTAVFHRQLADFMANHGHRSVMEAEAAARSWEEDKPTVYAMLRNYLHADPSSAPQRIEERQRREREEATVDVLRRLSWWQRPPFRYALREAQKGIAAREHTKSLLVRTSQYGRRLTRELAGRLVQRGLLSDLWDFYYLKKSEVRALSEGAMTPDEAASAIAKRKEEDARNRAVVLPETFRGRPEPLGPEDVALPDGDRLSGIAVSPGRVTGKARVILDPRDDAAIEPGEVLVAPVTDAGWTPLFVAAAGVVVDIGGTLSHGSTVAREYGLPAVVNVKHGTRMIRTGQTITVDGTEGVVTLEE